jgi:hypothetical protein
MQSRLANYSFQTRDLSRQDLAPRRTQPVSPPPGIVAGNLLHHPLIHQALQIVIERARPQLVSAVGLARDLLHNAVPVQVLSGQSQQNKQGRGRKREKIFHSSVSVISESECYVNPYFDGIGRLGFVFQELADTSQPSKNYETNPTMPTAGDVETNLDTARLEARATRPSVLHHYR